MRLSVNSLQQEDEELRRRGEPVAKNGPSPGVRDIKWHKAVYPGDTITFVNEIREKRDSSRKGFGLLVTFNTGTNQKGELVYSAQGAVFVERRPAQHTECGDGLAEAGCV